MSLLQREIEPAVSECSIIVLSWRLSFKESNAHEQKLLMLHLTCAGWSYMYTGHGTSCSLGGSGKAAFLGTWRCENGKVVVWEWFAGWRYGPSPSRVATWDAARLMDASRGIRSKHHIILYKCRERLRQRLSDAFFFSALFFFSNGRASRDEMKFIISLSFPLSGWCARSHFECSLNLHAQHRIMGRVYAVNLLRVLSRDV